MWGDKLVSISANNQDLVCVGRWCGISADNKDLVYVGR